MDLILYSAFSIATGIEIGFASLAVGYLIGKAMKFGAKGAGGRRYQIAAVLLTYAAVSISAVPIAISFSAKQRAAASRESNQSFDSPGDSPSAASSNQRDPAAPPQPHPSSASALLGLLALGLASPFLELQSPLNGAIGLFILFVGMRFAWQLTAGVEGSVLGPFQNRARTITPAS